MHKDYGKYYFRKPEFYRLTSENHYVRVDIGDKAMGHGQYTGDIMFPDMLTGKMMRSPHASVRILSIDAGEAEKLPGVRYILTVKGFEWKSLVGNGEFATEFADKEVLCSEKVRQIGDDVAAMMTVDGETAQRAIDLIKMEYEVLPSVFNPFEVMEEGAPETGRGDEGLHNIGMQSVMKAGADIDQEFGNTGYVQHKDYRTHRMVHMAMESRGVAATPRNGAYTIWMSTQTSYVDQFRYARCLGVEESQVCMIKPLVDDGFRGKLDSYSSGLCAVKMPELTGRPVRMILSREEVFQAIRNCHPIYMHAGTVLDTDGGLLVKECYYMLDDGPYGGSGVAACAQSTLWANFPYKMSSAGFLARRVYANNPSAGAMRGYTMYQVHFARDLNMQFVADQTGIDLVESRKVNTANPGYMTPAGLAITSCTHKKTLDTAIREIGWYDKKDQMRKGEGIGFARTGFVPRAELAVLEVPNQGSACATLRMNKRGMATLYIGPHDIGQGSDTVMTATMAGKLGLSVNMVKTFMSDTFLTPQDSGSHRNRVAFSAGDTARCAAVDAKRQLFKVIASMWGVMPETLECLDGKVISRENVEFQIPVGDAMFKYMTVRGGDKLVGIGSYYHHTDNSQYNGTNTTNHTPTYSFPTRVAHLTVDEKTGVPDIGRFVFVHDHGRVLNERAVEGQLGGSIGIGLGYATYGHDVTKRGKTLNSNPRDYRLPTVFDVPKIRAFYDFIPDKGGPLGTKEAGGGSVAPMAPAIANVVNTATGVYFTELPLDPEHIWRALHGLKDDRNFK